MTSIGETADEGSTSSSNEDVCDDGYGSHLVVSLMELIQEETSKGTIESVKHSQPYVSSLTLHVPYYRNCSFDYSSLEIRIRRVLVTIFQSCKNLNKLVLDGTQELEHACLDWRDSNEADGITSIIFELAAPIPSLRVLQLENVALGAGKALESFFGNCPSLSCLSVFRKWPITLECAQALSRGLKQSSTIQRIRLLTTYSEYDCWHVDTLLRGFQSHQSLKGLSIEISRPTDACYRSIRDILSGNRVLESLKLQINLCRHDDKGESLIPLLLALNKDTSGLKRLELTGCLPPTPAVTIALLCALQNSALQELKLRLFSLASDQASSLALGVSRNTTIKVLKISTSTVLRGKVVALDCISLERLLKDNTHITDLDLSRCGIINSEDAHCLGTGLATNRSLLKLGLSGNYLGPTGATNFINALQPNRTLTSLDISHCGLDGMEGGRAVKRLLEWKSVLIFVNLDGNKIGPTGAPFVSEGLELNGMLKYLSIESCGLEASGCDLIYRGLQFHRAITCLRIRLNQEGRGSSTSCVAGMLENPLCALKDLWIGGQYMEQVFQAMFVNKTLRAVHFEDDSIVLDNPMLMRVCRALICNSTLERLDLGQPRKTFDFDSSGVQQFLNLLPEMKGIKYIHGLNRFQGMDRHNLIDTVGRVLCHNKVLIDMGDMSNMKGTSRSLVWFYLQLNRRGRQFWHSNGIRHYVWPFLLAKMTMSKNPVDTGCLFHFLANKPNLICSPRNKIDRKRKANLL